MSCHTTSEDNQTLSLDRFIIFRCRRISINRWGWFIDSRIESHKRTEQSAAYSLGCARSSLSNYPDHWCSPTGTSGDNTPRSLDFPRCRVWPTTPRLWVFRPGGAQCRQDVAVAPFVTRRNNQVRHANLPPRRMIRGRPKGRPSSRCRSHGRCRRLTCGNNDKTSGKSGPGERLRGWEERERERETSWEFVDVLVAWSCDVMRASRVENMLPRALALFHR